jgi:hypothetical protein
VRHYFGCEVKSEERQNDVTAVCILDKVAGIQCVRYEQPELTETRYVHAADQNQARPVNLI